MKKNYIILQNPTSIKSSFLILLLLLQSFCLSLYANTYTVTNTAEGPGNNQLRGAIDNASGIAGTHIITVNAGIYNLSSTINVGNVNNQNITIIAAAGTTPIIDIGNIDRIFIFNTTGGTTGLSITLSGFTLRNGRLSADNFGGGAILGGGTTNNYTISNCTFTNNSISTSQVSTPGGALRFSGGGAVTISNCTFTGNSNPKSDGGALRFDLQNGEAGSLTVTNSVFTNNTVTGSIGQGGAISLGIAGLANSSAFSCSITGCTFTGNTAPGTSGAGGAMSIVNSNPGSTANINYNRFYNNTATNSNRSAVAIAATSGNVNLSNNWWGCNDGPTSCADKVGLNASGGTGTNTLTPYLLLTSPQVSVCAGSGVTVNSGFTKNNANQTIAASNLTAFNGLTITFNNPTLGTISPTTATIVTGTGQASTTYTAGSTGGTGYVYAKTDNVPDNDIISRDTITINPAPSVTNPGSTTVCAGTTATFSATGSGSGTLSYQWYKGTTALSNGATGTGSTLAGVTTSTLTITNLGTSDAATNYNVRVSSTTGCGPATSSNASLTVNTLPGFSTQPSSITSGACTGNPISFSTAASGSGTLSYRWYKGSTGLNDGATGTGSTISGSTTATLTISNPSPSDNATNYNVVVSSSTGCTPTTSNNVTLTITPPTTATATTSATESISSTNTLITNSSCNVIVNVVPSGASPVSGNVTATTTVQGSVQVSSNGSPYAPRYYDIVPATNAATATATLTLYFTQGEFSMYNAYPGHGLNLPVDATDAANYKANIRIYIFHGAPNGGGNFPAGSTELIDPVDANIVWNSTYSRWEVTFNTVGFSRYYLASAGSTILPLNSIALTGHTDGSTAWLAWKVTGEKDVIRYEIEHSKDGAQFTTIGQVAVGNNYQFTDQPAEKILYYYRIKVIDKDGRYSYSPIIAINLKKVGAIVQVLPNPFREKLLLNISTAQLANTEVRLMDMSGKVLVKKIVTLPAGTSALTIDKLEGLAKGTYLLQVKNERMNETIKVLKAD